MTREKFYELCNAELYRLVKKWKFENLGRRHGPTIAAQPKPNARDFFRGAEFAWNLLTDSSPEGETTSRG